MGSSLQGCGEVCERKRSYLVIRNKRNCLEGGVPLGQFRAPSVRVCQCERQFTCFLYIPVPVFPWKLLQLIRLEFKGSPCFQES